MVDENSKIKRDRAYRAVLINVDGRPETTVTILASGEADALGQARDIARLFAVELWDGGRFITRVPRTRPD